MTILQELRHAVRGLTQRPLFTVVAVLSIALGIGANTAMFSVINALLLRVPPGLGQPDRVVEIGRTEGNSGFDTFSYPELQAMQRAVGPLSHVAGYRTAQMSLSTSGDGERVLAFATSAEYFPALGVQPDAGRFFSADEVRTAGSEAVVVVSHLFWQNRMGARADAVGTRLVLNRTAFTVVGVAPAGFHGHMPVIRPDVYVPITMMPVVQPGFGTLDDARGSWLQAIGRLAPGATVEQARQQVAATFASLGVTNPQRYENRSATVQPIGSVPAGGRMIMATFLIMLSALAGLVLLVTCTNVAGMLLARAAGREREIAIRLALGAGRARLVRQLVTESLVLFALGGTAGLLIALWGMRAMSAAHIPAPFPIHLDFNPDMRVLLAGFAAALITGVLFGLAPALQATKPSLVPALKNDSRRSGSSGGLMRRVFVAAQIGVTVLLLTAAGLFLRALQRASDVDIGFSADDVVLTSINLAMDGYSDDEGRAFHRDLLSALRATPGVGGAALASDLPLDMGISESSVYPLDGPGVSGVGSAFAHVDGGYFETLDVAVLRGRVFDARDAGPAAAVAVVSRGFADRLWPGEDALGKHFRWESNDATPLEVIGVVADVKNQMLMETTEPMVYLPVTQEYRAESYVLVHAAAGNGATILRDALRRMDPRLSRTEIQRLADINALGVLPQRAGAAVATVFGILALLLSAMGVYGVVAYMVAQRTREIGVRMALGADRNRVVRMILGNGLRIAVPGALFGVAAGFGLGMLMRSFILGVAPTDAVAMFGAPLVLIGAVVLACWVPASRAAGVEPVRALRSE